MPKDLAVLEHSQDPQLLMRTAAEFAASDTAEDHTILLRQMELTSFLNRLDSAERYQAPPRRLRLGRVMQTLMRNRTTLGWQVLVSLTQSQTFTAVEPRQELLIRSLWVVRPSPPQAIDFWSHHSQPESPYLHITIAALARNGSEPALALLQKRLADPRFEEEVRIAWMRGAVLEHRNDVPMLYMCGRLLSNGLEPELRTRLVEALFDYHDEWYRSCDPPKAPPRSQLSAEGRTLLRSIGEYALRTVNLTPALKATVELVLREIGGEK